VNEKHYKMVGGAGVWSLVLGILSVVFGVAAGVMMIINGARLLKSNEDILI
jgi:hypothetical protein